MHVFKFLLQEYGHLSSIIRRHRSSDTVPAAVSVSDLNRLINYKRLDFKSWRSENHCFLFHFRPHQWHL